MYKYIYIFMYSPQICLQIMTSRVNDRQFRPTSVASSKKEKKTTCTNFLLQTLIFSERIHHEDSYFLV